MYYDAKCMCCVAYIGNTKHNTTMDVIVCIPYYIYYMLFYLIKFDSFQLEGNFWIYYDFDILIFAGMMITVKADSGKQFSVVMRFDTDLELTYFKHGGILNYMVRKVAERN